MFGITRQGNDLDPIRDEAVDILRMQYRRGNNGYVKTKYVTLTIEAENLPAARARFARIETDTLNRFKVMGAAAHVLDGKERLELLYNILHPEGGQFAFEWDWLPASGLSVKDFISPSSFHFGRPAPSASESGMGRCPSCKSWRPRCTTVSSPTSWRRTEISW